MDEAKRQLIESLKKASETRANCAHPTGIHNLAVNAGVIHTAAFPWVLAPSADGL